MWRASDWPWTKDPAYAAGPMWMDDVHVEAIYRICMEIGFRKILEIGCFDGHSTSAIVQAKIETAVGLLVCCDREIRPALWKTLARSRDGWGVWQDRSVDVLQRMSAGDLLVLDSDHDLATTQSEMAIVLANQWPTVILHDVGTLGKQPGPLWAREELRNNPEWFVLVDEQAREGMATHRGLLVATKLRSVYERASKVWPEGRLLQAECPCGE